MTIYKITADGRCELKEIKNTLEAMQAEVGGYIETARFFSDDDLTCIVNEEGWLLGLPANKKLPNIAGDLFFVGVNGEEFCSLVADQVYCLQMMFERKE